MRNRVEKTKNKNLRRLASALVSSAILAGALPQIGNRPVQAAWTKNQSNTRLNTYQIASPVKPSYVTDAWKGSYVYFGKFDGTPVVYRVLCPSTAKFGTTTMLLDCNTILYYDCFDQDGEANSGAVNPNEWAYSDVKARLNGKSFLNRANGFTDVEKNAIASSKIGSHALALEFSVNQQYKNYVALNGEKIFLLDAEDVLNSAYGYYPSCGYDTEDWEWEDIGSRIKMSGDSPAAWWLRSASDSYSLDAGKVEFDGYNDACEVHYGLGVSPALNIDTSNVLFSSAVTGAYGAANTIYKLTLKDPGISVSLTSGKFVYESGSSICVPYTVSGSHASSVTQMSLLITDRAYNDSASILFYGKTTVSGSVTSSGVASFTLPSNLNYDNWGTGYHVYLVPEDINGNHETDYAATPFEVTISKTQITKAEPNDCGVQLRWNKLSGFDGYNVYRSDSASGTYNYLASVTGGTVSYVDKTAESGKTYFYKVRPYVKSGGSTLYAGWSKAKKVVILSNTKLTATPKSGVTMSLSWTAVSGAQAYEIYRATSASGPYTYIKATTGTSTSDTGLTAGTRYYYMIRARKTVDGVNQYSKYASAVAVALATPTMESAQYTAGKGVKLTWTKASGADRYNVYRYNGSTYVYVASVLGGNLTYTDSNGKKGDYYKVRAYKKVGGVVYYGGWSNAKAGK